MLSPLCKKMSDRSCRTTIFYFQVHKYTHKLPYFC